jgi:hypothetical protein
MIFVAIAAAVAYSHRLRSLSAIYRWRAELHDAEADVIEALAIDGPGGGRPVSPLWRDELWRDEMRHLKRLAAKYKHAARYPWLPVEPDPPEPE